MCVGPRAGAALTESLRSSGRAASEAQLPDDRYLPGEIIDGKYRLVRPLAQGGSGHVWLAHNLVLDVPVGVKLIYSNAETATARGERLLQEARAAARLGHPAIVRVFDFGETRHDDPFFAMEMLNGETLAEALARDHRISAIRAIQTLLPIADALSAAHAKGIVHRDVKPQNIFISRDEAGRVQPKLLDFGIARVGSAPKLTLQGTVLGTPDYMSPEQARGDGDIDERTDIWSFCVVLYELVSGEPPFKGENYNALLYSIIRDEPRPLSDFAAGDTALWTLLQDGLHKAPERRWKSMRALGVALARWLYERGVREDICAASLKTNWLDSATLDSSAGGGPSQAAALRPGALASLETPTLEADRGIVAASAPRKRGRPLAVTALLLAFALGLLLVTLGRRQPQSPASATLSAREPTPRSVIQSPPSSVRTEPTRAPVVPLATLSPSAAAPAAVAATAPRSVAIDAGTKRARRPKATTATPGASPENSKDPDLGF
jgi:serine/threonine-protein kinase